MKAEEIESRLVDHFGINRDILYKQYRGPQPQKAYYRHIFIYCMRVFTGMTIVEIGKRMNFDHTNVSNSMKCVRGLCSVDLEFRNKIIEIEKMFE